MRGLHYFTTMATHNLQPQLNPVTPPFPRIRERESELYNAHLAAIVASSSDAILSKTLEGIIISWNRGAEGMFGYSAAEVVGRSIAILIPPEKIAEEGKILARLKMGERIEHYETVRRTKDGRRLDVSLTISPVHNAAGQVVAASKIIRDISDRKRAEVQIRHLAREVNHRAGNLLSVVQAIARQTANGANPATFLKDLTNRIAGLAASHSFLGQKAGSGVGVADLARVQLAPFGGIRGDRISISGPNLRFSLSAGQTIGMALHELASNACKHGALSHPNGHVDINWKIEDSATPEFVMSWREAGGPPVVPPTRTGFGHKMIVQMTEAAVRGRVDIDYRKEGFTWRLRAPASETLELPFGGE
jgi:PAS domain S-box-containing protein